MTTAATGGHQRRDQRPRRTRKSATRASTEQESDAAVEADTSATASPESSATEVNAEDTIPARARAVTEPVSRLLVAIAPDEHLDHSERILRAARSFADALDVPWTVACVETPVVLGLVRPQRDSRVEMFRLAESLGAETVTLEATSPSEALVQYAKLCDAATILVGAPRRRPGLLRLARESVVTKLLHYGLDADVIVIPRDAGDAARIGERGFVRGTWIRSRLWAPYLGAIGITALCTAITLPMLDHFDLIDMVMVYMLGATLAALRLGRGPAVCTALANIAAFDYFFIPPRFSFWVSDPHYVVTFSVMLAVAAIIANLVTAVRQQTVAAVARERRTAALYAMSRELAITRDADTMATIAERHITELTQSATVVLILDEHGELQEPTARGNNRVEFEICRWVLEHRRRAGLGAEHFPAERAIYLPLLGSHDARGVLVVKPSDPRRALLPEQMRLLETLASQLAQALERVRLAEVAQAARLVAERAALRNTLLASISHDLRTPLSAIAGAGSMMAHESFPLDLHRRTTLGRLIEDKARDMTELLSNVLELMRLETGTGGLKRDWHSLEDLVGQALRQNEGRLAQWQVYVELPPDLPLLFVESSLIVQMLNNLLENSVKYTPAGTKIVIAATTVNGKLQISVEDNGPGFPPGDPERLFDKFERGRSESNIVGAGLGLAICRAVARLHGGEIRGMRAASGGARIEITLPLKPPRAPPPTSI